ncbi:MAG: hypothetical protein A2104_02145 [Candidatus Melainabacteria bacterium GWF2_32_7]|nr:MAG: hypothetical protein A2104_02145 [Candidatus Melainabacteria bacterium GWF2_32_7]
MTTTQNVGLTEKELNECQKVVKEALNVLGKDNLSLIMHGVSFPSKSNEDTGTGTINSNGARELINFVEQLGFNSIQLGPDGKTKSNDASPYVGTIFSTNSLFIDLYELTTPEWDEILRKSTFDNIVENNPNKGQSRLAYTYIYQKQNEALYEAYNSFKTKLADKKPSKTIKEIEKKFKKFQKENKEWLDKDALYEALSKKHNNDYWPIWKDKLDKNLFTSENKGIKAAKERIAEIEKTYAEEIEFYKFSQFIANEQKEKTKEYTLAHNIKTMADIQVAFSDRDYWANQSIFMTGYHLGCPPDYFSEDGQAWGFPVLDPEKIVDEKGKLLEAGQLLKERFDKVFKENPGGARIDHAVGLVDPWVYKIGKTAKPEDGGRRLYSSPDAEEFKKYSRIGVEDLNNHRVLEDPEVKPEDLDKILPPENELRVKEESLDKQEIFDKYCEVVNIILEAAKENKVGKESIIFEDLGTVTNPVMAVMKKLGLCGIRVTQFVTPEEPDHMYRGRNVGEHHWITPGTHDNMPLSICVADWYKSNTIEPHIQYLAEDLVSESDKGTFIEKLRHNPNEFIKAKFIELFTSPSKNAQVFFTDMFGIDEAYNKPGTSGDKNWSLRLPNNFKEIYYSSLSQNKGFNLPEILKLAIEAKGGNFINEVNTKHPELLQKLVQYSEKFKN